MKTYLQIYKLKRKLEPDEEEDNGEANDMRRYVADVRRSENFEVGDYPIPGTHIPDYSRGERLQLATGVPIVAKIYDSSHSKPGGRQAIHVDRLLSLQETGVISDRTKGTVKDWLEMTAISD
ncbi:hypothetical protein POM88_043738 [Heracleum sosnowskyi]|uniref:Uncharacterized protein n=1 Tax=Heracleum sosnowskyi TaxID=360622 RepID=A0AAD8H3X8_9APIA|nr:hypothetical protein POM88_043738 [Heracleum sosnowskyi]